MNVKIVFYAACIFLVIGCSDSFLDEKPASSIINPKSLEECRSLLENDQQLNNKMPAFVQLASDEYYYDEITWQSTVFVQERNAYIWKDDIYDGNPSMTEWNNSFYSIYITNVVLGVLENIEITALNEKEYEDIKGTALFFRAMWNFALAETFCMPYSKESAASELGIPLRKSPNVNTLEKRASLKETYEAIIEDLEQALFLLQSKQPTIAKNRPSIATANALLARVFLVMADFDKAYKHASNSFSAYSSLLDYNTLNLSEDVVFGQGNPEILLMAIEDGYSSTAPGRSSPNTFVDSTLIELYDLKDLRLQAYFTFNSDKKANRKNLYSAGISSFYCFRGIATDEVLLILAECLARKNELKEVKTLLDKLYQNRFASEDVPVLTFKNVEDALHQVLDERRKELLFRGTRWSDVRRLNVEGRNISMKRSLGKNSYILEPNSLKYAFLIPNNELELSGLVQNKR